MSDGLKLDFGCGPNKREGFQGVDSIAFPGVDFVVDLRQRWPWEDNSVAEAHASHFIEHLTAMERVHFANELYRVLKPGGKCTVIVPHWGSCRAYGDPTHCFSDDTEILTATGWQTIANVRVGERVPTLDLATEQTRMTDVVAVINNPYVGEMLHFQSDRMDLVVTPNHDMVWRAKGGNAGYWRKRGKPTPRPVLRKSPADSFVGLVGRHPRRGIATFPWAGDSPQRIRIAPDEASLGRVLPGEFDAGDFAELLGWFVSEGNVDLSRPGGYRVQIAQSRTANPDKYQQITRLIQRLGFSPSLHADRIRFSSKALALYLAKLGLCHEKFVPAVIKELTPQLLRRFLVAAVAGDGRVNRRGWEYATTSRRLADDVQEVAAKAGYRTSIRQEVRAGLRSVIGGRVSTTLRDIYMVGISPPTDVWYPQPKSVHYAGRIVCVTLADCHTVYVRRNGRPLWSGNCWPPVSEFWCFYLSKAWRAQNAPHTDAAHLPGGFDCDLEATWGYGLHPQIALRHQDAQQFATQFYKEAVQDLHATLTKKAPAA
jgi:hypothetical protein